MFQTILFQKQRMLFPSHKNQHLIHSSIPKPLEIDLEQAGYELGLLEELFVCSLVLPFP
jgi:hypothetical protein